MRGRKISDEEVVKTVTDKYGDSLKEIETYIDGKRRKVKAICTSCGRNIDCRLDILLKRDFPCNFCATKRHVHTPEEAEAILHERFGDKLSMDISTFTRVDKKPDIWCNDCGYHLNRQFRDILQYTVDTVCPICSDGKIVNADFEIVRKRVLDATNGTIDLIKEFFKGASKLSKAVCLVCGNEWYVHPTTLYKKRRGCGKCYGHYLHTYQEAKELVDKKFNKSIDFFEDEFKNLTSDVHFVCKKCGHIWVSSVNGLLRTQGCLKCTLKNLESLIMEVLDKKEINYKHDKGLAGSNYNGSNLPLRGDFRFDDYPILIEIDGKQHFAEVEGCANFIETQARDRHKDEYCKENGICLIRITSSPTKEWGTEKHLTLDEGLKLLNRGIINKKVNMQLFWEYDFNRD